MHHSNPLLGLIFIPTYNEIDNVERLINQLDQMNLGFDYLFIDDNSPDKTGDLLEKLAETRPNLHVVHRPHKMGIGSAHIDGINWAYKHGYQILITMDSDFSHSPAYIERLLALCEKADVVVGSRYLQRDSLSEWNLTRKFLTNTGHFLTKVFFRMPYDATGAFRLYRLDKISAECFNSDRSLGYSFFFESLFILFKNNYAIIEVAIDLPARTYGQSKMKFRDAFNSLILLLKMGALNFLTPKVFLISKGVAKIETSPTSINDLGWEKYWNKEETINNRLYDRIASLFRQWIIRPNLNRHIFKNFSKGATLLHAGCGGGQVDVDVTNAYPVIAMDLSINALNLYKKNHIHIEKLVQNDIRKMNLEDKTVDGIYSLGVMEHFSENDILVILKEFWRVLKPNGKIILFWPPKFGFSVIILRIWHLIANNVFHGNVKLHPAEVSLLESKEQIEGLARQSGFSLLEYHFGVTDFFTQVIVILRKTDNTAIGD